MIEIRSYRRVFALERRIYRIDRLRLNPSGVPVRGVVYLIAILSTELTLSRLPVLRAVAQALPWYISDLALPGLGAALLSVIRIDGRTFHLTAHALVRRWLQSRPGQRFARPSSRRICWRPDTLVLLPDGSDAHLRRLSYRGPGAVLVAVEHERAGALTERDGIGVTRRRPRAVLVIRGHGNARPLERGQVIALGPGARLKVRSSVPSGL